MTTYQFIKEELSEEQLAKMVKGGIISSTLYAHYQIYDWHVNNGRSDEKTAEHFKMSRSSVSYARKQMKQEI